MLDRWWDGILVAGPPGVALIVATLLALAPGEERWRTTAGLSCALAALAYVAVVMTGVAVRGGRQLYRTLVSGQPDGDIRRETRELLAAHWSVSLFQVRNADSTAPTTVLDALPRALPEPGGVLCLERAVTSPAGREALRRDPRVHAHERDEALLVIQVDSSRPALSSPAPDDTHAAGPLAFLRIYVLGITAVIAVMASFIPDWERANCAKGPPAGWEVACDERPITYFDALYWLLNRLSGGDPEGLGAASFQARSIGLLITLLAVVTVTVVLESLSQYAANGRATADDRAPAAVGAGSPIDTPAVSRPADATAPTHVGSLSEPTTIPAQPAAAALREQRLLVGFLTGVIVGTVLARRSRR